MGDLTGRVALVTAAASGMGRASSVRLAEEGAHVVACDVDAAGGRSLVALITGAGGSVEFHRVDVTDVAALQSLVAEVESTHGRIDVLFSHAGATAPKTVEIDVEDWAFQVDINLRPAVVLTPLVLPLMRSGSSLIFTSSASGIRASTSPVYSLVKAGLLGYMRSVASLEGPRGIRANAICPGPIATDMLLVGGHQDGLPPGRDDLVRAIPLGRLGRADEVAELVVFLAGDRSSFISGSTIPIDGGYSIAP